MSLTAEQCLIALGISAAQREGVPIHMLVQKDSAFVWKAAAIHPLQPLENAYQRIVRRYVDDAGRREAEFEKLSKFFLFDDATPATFSLPPAAPPEQEPLAAVKMNYAIGTFYLFRLLVQFAVESTDPVTDERRANVSGTLTSLLHNDKTYMSWLTAWLTEKMGELGDEIENLNRGGDKVLFFLKGGRALKYFLGKPGEGQNDWDTQILINPNLPAEEWYALFARVHDRMLAKLTEFKMEFTELVESHNLEFDRYIRSIQLDLPAIAEEEEEDEYEEESSRAEGGDVGLEDVKQGDVAGHYLANCKAELIDIGIPRRDTPAALEEWSHLNGKLLGNRVKYPGHQYYLAEYLMMVREAFLENSDVRKTPKRVQRLNEILALDSLGPAIKRECDAVRAILPKIATVAEGRSETSRRLLTLMMHQFIEAYDLREDTELTACYDTDFAAALSNTASTVKIRPELEQAIRNFKDWTPENETVVKDIGFGHQVSTRMSSHYQDRAAFMKEQRKTCRAFISHVYEAFDLDEELEVEFAIAGSYAAHLHGKYLRFDRMSDLEPIRRIDLKLYTLPGASQGVLKYVQPRIEELVRESASPFELKVGAGPSLLLYWRTPVKIGEFAYKPLTIKVSVQEETRLPQLSFIKGLPVLDLRYLAVEYRRRCAAIDEVGVRAVLNSATKAVAEILSSFDY